MWIVSTFGTYVFLQKILEFCSGVIGFLLCAKEGPPVNFLTPINPIEKLEGATKAGREIRFYNSEVSSFSVTYYFLCQYMQAVQPFCLSMWDLFYAEMILKSVLFIMRGCLDTYCSIFRSLLLSAIIRIPDVRSLPPRLVRPD